MSFFGFDTSGHAHAKPGFGQAHDPFAGLSGHGDVDDALEFEDTYDGLGDQLDDADDAFNDDTFGGGGGGGGGGGNETAAPSGKVGKDFDFFGKTAQVAGAFEEEHARFQRQQPAPRAAPPPVQPQPQQGYYQQQHQYQPAQPVQQTYRQPARTGYEKYKESEPMADLSVDRSIWGMGPAQGMPQLAPIQAQAPQAAHAPSRKMMSLEEVEASMRQQSQPAASPQPPQPVSGYQQTPPPGYQQHPQQYAQQYPQHHQAQQHQPQQPQHGHPQPVQILQRPQSIQQKPTPPQGVPTPQQHQHQQAPPSQPTQILQNPNRMSGDPTSRAASGHQHTPSQGAAPGLAQLQSHPQFNQMSDEEKAAFLDQETKRAKRNHKIWMLSKDNGLMTPQDKNFITRIQLQQLVSATGNPSDHDTDAPSAEDFYYQVYSAIRAGQRQNPSQPLSNFAQTYLFQTGGRHGGMRRHGRPAENHFQRMEQQVQRAVEAAKNKPKNPQLVIEGSLGKISFSNAKTPKPLLNIKRNDSDTARPSSAKKPQPHTTGVDRRAVLRSVEKVYDLMMSIEAHRRLMPPAGPEGPSPEMQALHDGWKATLDGYINSLWEALQVHHPVDTVVPHPFIAFLSCAKGKRAIPRIFPMLDFEKRTTILTLIIYYLDQLDVVQGAATSGDTSLNSKMREDIELFIGVVMPPLMAYFNEAGLDIVDGVLNLVAMKSNVEMVAKTRVGVSVLTLILSRAVVLKQSGEGNEEQWAKWDKTFEVLFNKLEVSLPYMFPGSVNSGEDMYVWQLLAGMGVNANHDQQTRLVLAVKDRVLDTVQVSKGLPAAMASDRLSSVNLFMRAIGLDVELLQ